MLRKFSYVLVLVLLAGPATAELTDYQRGVLDGIQAALSMGRLLGMSEYDPAMATDFNQAVDPWNAWLVQIFSENQTVIENYSLQKIEENTTEMAFSDLDTSMQNSIDQTALSQIAADQATDSSIVHEIDGRAREVQPEPLVPAHAQEPLIHGYPKSVYCTWFPDAASCQS